MESGSTRSECLGYKASKTRSSVRHRVRFADLKRLRDFCARTKPERTYLCLRSSRLAPNAVRLPVLERGPRVAQTARRAKPHDRDRPRRHSSAGCCRWTYGGNGVIPLVSAFPSDVCHWVVCVGIAALSIDDQLTIASSTSRFSAKIRSRKEFLPDPNTPLGPKVTRPTSRLSFTVALRRTHLSR